jgi:hypothetical protein
MAPVRLMRSLALLCLVLLGCMPSSGDPAPAVATPTGHWVSPSGPDQVDVTLTVRGTVVSGSGRFIDGQGRRSPLTITGEYTAPTFSVQLTSHDQVVARYIGRLDSPDTLRGLLYHSSVPPDSLILTRLSRGVDRPLFRPVW